MADEQPQRGSGWLDRIEILHEKHGFSTLMAIAFFLVVFGFIPSPMMDNQKILLANQAIMVEHQEESRDAMREQVDLGRANCVIQALQSGNKELILNLSPICIATGRTQELMIERAITQLKKIHASE